ncbi:hypothetical protein J2S09_000485 [Bacillus fengqiuensis]|nr:hypothetical protein [Bacillus fengqiuensis]
MIRKWCFLIFISNCIFFNNQVLKAESIQGRDLPAVDHETEQLDSLYKKEKKYMKRCWTSIKKYLSFRK